MEKKESDKEKESGKEKESNKESESGKKNSDKEKSGKKKLIITVSVILVIVLILYIYLFLGTKQKNVSKEIEKGDVGTNSLIIYFTRSGNIKAKNASDVDATSSASMKANDGATEFAAKKLQEVTGADLYEIKTSRRYRASYFGTVATAFIEERFGLRPDITAFPENLDKYDIIYVGYPIWWFNAPMAIGTFLEHYDLTGKTIVPFCTSQDNDIDVSMKYIRKVSKGAEVLEGYRFSGTTTEADIRNWLDGIGIKSREADESKDVGRNDRSDNTEENAEKNNNNIVDNEY